MATWTDTTAFRVISEDGELITPPDASMPGRTLSDFEMYAEASALVEGEIAQWYVPRTDEMLAEQSDEAGITVYPTADIFN